METKIKSNNNSEILIVEDSPTQLQQLQYLLEAHDYKVITAVNGKLGLESARKHSPAIIISDIVMPEMNGYELCKAIRSDEALKDIPIVLLTSLSSPADVIEALKSGADNFIRKPYDEKLLFVRIDNILTNRKLRSSDKVRVGVELYLGGDKHFITSERQQILDLLISTYEQAVELCGSLKIREQQLDRANIILRGIYRIAKGLNSAMTQKEVIEQVLDRALELPDVRAGWFSILEGDSDFKLAGSRGLPPALEVPGAMEGDCLCRRKVLAGEIDRSMNITECERLKKAEGETLGLRSHVTIPLRSGNSLMGILNLVGTEQVLFNDDDLAVLNGIGNQIGAALYRCLMHEHLEELVKERTAALTMEIEERKKAEKSLTQSEEHFRILFEQASDGIFITDINGNFIGVNSSGSKMLGYSREEILQKNLFDIDTADPDSLPIKIDELKKGNNLLFETKLRKNDGSLLDAEVNAKMLSDGKLQGIVRNITERKHAEEAIRRSEEKYRTIFENSVVGIYQTRIDGEYISANAKLAQILGYKSPDELMAGVRDVNRQFYVKPERREEFTRIVEEQKSIIGFESQVYRKDGSVIWVSETGRGIYDSDGKLTGFEGITIDITELKQAEQALHHSYDLLNLTGQMAKVGGWELDIETQALSWTEEVYRIHEIDPATRLNVTEAINFYAPEARPVISNAVQACIESGSPWDLELPLITVRGRHIWVRAQGAAERLNGKTVRLYGAFQDITERKRAEVERARLISILESTTDLVGISDANLKAVYLNKAGRKMIGIGENEYLNFSVTEAYPEWAGKKLTDEALPIVVRDGVWSGEMALLTGEGREVPVSQVIIAHKDPKGKIEFLSTIIRDMTESKQAEQELIKAKELAELSNKLKDAFIANISHEIRTPLNGILGMTSLIKDTYAENATEEEKELFIAVDISSKRIIRTVDMILNFSRLQVGEYPVTPKEVELSSICKNLVQGYMIAAKEVSLELSFENRCKDSTIFADEYSVTQAVSNLIDNAIKYTKKGFVKVIIYKGSNDEVMLDVKDSGIGIEKDYLNNVFEPYWQEDMGYGRAYEGVGLGLSLVKKFLGLNNADISAESKKGEGTTFTIKFSKEKQTVKDKAPEVKKADKDKRPGEEAVSSLPAKDVSAKTPGKTQADRKDRLVLLVEDDPINQTAIKRFIESKYHALITNSSDGAVEILKNNKVDIILMDISIKGTMDGLELTKELKASREYSHIPVIAVTAHAFDKDRANAFEAGCDEYLSKPFSMQLLLDTIAKFV